MMIASPTSAPTDLRWHLSLLSARYFDHGKTLTDGSWEFDYAVEPFANSTLDDATLNKAVLGELFTCV